MSREMDTRARNEAITAAFNTMKPRALDLGRDTVLRRFMDATLKTYGVADHPRASAAYRHAIRLAALEPEQGSLLEVLTHFHKLICLLEIGVAAQAPARAPLRLGVAVIVTLLPYSDADLLILWGKRRGAHGAGTWAFAGGEVKPGESIEEAAARELAEETGIVVPVSDVEMIHHAQPVVHPNGERWLCFVATVRVHRETEAEVLEPEKCEAWAWRRLHDLPSPVFPPNQVQISDGVLDDIGLLR